MPTTIQPTLDIIRTETLASGASSSITMPAGSWFVSSVTSVGDGTTELAVADGDGVVFQATTAAPATGLTTVSDNPDTVCGASLVLTAAGGGTGVTYVRITLSSALGRALTAS